MSDGSPIDAILESAMDQVVRKTVKERRGYWTPTEVMTVAQSHPLLKHIIPDLAKRYGSTLPGGPWHFDKIVTAGFVRRRGWDSNPGDFRPAVFKMAGAVRDPRAACSSEAGVDPRVMAGSDGRCLTEQAVNSRPLYRTNAEVEG